MSQPIHRPFAKHALAALALAISASAAPAAAVVAFAPSVVKPVAATPSPAGADGILQQQAEWAILAALGLGIAIAASRVRSNRQPRSVAS